MRISTYTRIIDLPNDESLVINIPRRVADLVPTSFASQLHSPDTEMGKEWHDYAVDVGFITADSLEQEIEWFTDLVTSLRQEHQPVNVMAVTTNTCNFACSYCFQADSGMRRLTDRHLSSIEAESILARMRAFAEGPGIGQFELMGGEPLLPRLRDVVTRLVLGAEELSVPVRVTTNGFFLDEFAELLGAGRIAEVQISLDGTPDAHNARRIPLSGQPTFDRILSNIKLALARGVRVQVRSNVDRRNVDSLPGLIDILRAERILSNPLASFHAVTVHPDPFSPERGVGDHYMSQEEVRQRIPEVDEPDQRFITRGLTAGIRGIIESIFVDACGAPSRNYYFAPGGEIYNCHELIGRPDKAIGSFSRVTLRELPIRALWRARTVDQLENCRTCSLALAHGGGCGARLEGDALGRFGVCGDFPRFFDEAVRALARGESVDLGISCGSSCSQ